ncbi:hypothetical protein KY289_008339 [Solanum tuberosum]|nr:hypothetical protein KY289_008339 [Solanum tuberosum]
MRPISYLHGEPRIIWEEEEVTQMIFKENLQYAVIGKFSYGMPEIRELRSIIPKQCEMKGECNIRLLGNRHVLIRAANMEDYVNLLSKPAFYLTHRQWSYPMRTLKWDPMFDPEEETTTAIAWISFPSLPPIFFVKEALFLLAVAVGNPLQVDMATKNQTRPSCARVKVEVDLLGEFPKRINIGVRKLSGEVVEKWVRIKYDHVPKYCTNCRLQGHNEHECYVLHPELYPKKMEEIEKELGDRQNGRANRTVSEEKETQMGNQREMDGNKEEFQVQRNKKHQGKGRQQVWNPKQPQPHKGVEEKMTTENKFEALEDSEQKEAEEKRSKEIISTRKWVENAFNKPNREDGQRDTVEREKEIMHETNQEQKDMPPGDMGEGSALTLWEPICETDNAQKKVLPHPISIIEPNS